MQDDILARLKDNDASLEEVSFNGKNLGNYDAQTIANILKLNSKLLEINLRWNEIGDEGASALADALKTNSTLQTLNLADNLITKDGAIAIANALLVNNTLEAIFLTKNQIDDEGLKAISKALNANSSLRDIRLEYNPIGKNGIIALAEALKINTTLNHIVLSSNYRIGPDGGKALAKVMLSNTHVLNIYISGCAIDLTSRKTINLSSTRNRLLQKYPGHINLIKYVFAAKGFYDMTHYTPLSLRTLCGIFINNKKLLTQVTTPNEIETLLNELCILNRSICSTFSIKSIPFYNT